MRESDVRTVLLFFSLLFVDEKQVREYSHQVLSRYRNHLIEKKREEDPLFLLQAVQTVAQKNRSHYKTVGLGAMGSTFLQRPSDFDFGAWMDLRKTSSIEELSVLIWSHILNQPLELISQILDVSIGTLHHRLSHTLRRLGGLRTLRVV